MTELSLIVIQYKYTSEFRCGGSRLHSHVVGRHVAQPDAPIVHAVDEDAQGETNDHGSGKRDAQYQSLVRDLDCERGEEIPGSEWSEGHTGSRPSGVAGLGVELLVKTSVTRFPLPYLMQ